MVAHWRTTGGVLIASRMAIKPSYINELPPFADLRDVKLKLGVSKVDRPDWFSDQMKIPGTLTIELVDLKLGLAPDYVKKMRDIFGQGAAPRPDVPEDLPPQAPKIFIEYKNVNAAHTDVPLTLIVSFFPWPLILLSLGGLAVLALLAALAMMFMKERPFHVLIEGEDHVVGLRALQSREVVGAHQTYIVSRGAFGAPVVKPKATKPA
jgi:hypothetical protein